MQVFALVRRHFTLSFVLLLVGNFLVVRQMSKDKDALKNNYSPKGIISLELTMRDDLQKNILQTWANTPVEQTNMTALQVAQRQTRIDYFFILFYTALLCLLMVRLAPVHRRALWIRAAVSLGIAAGLLDCIENIFMQRAMNYRTVSSWQIWLPSAAKWLLVFGLSCVILFKSLYLLYAGLQKNWGERKRIKPLT
jgi:hypothetical protein